MYFNKKRWKEYKERMKLNCCILCQPRLLSEFFYITHTEEEIYDAEGREIQSLIDLIENMTLAKIQKVCVIILKKTLVTFELYQQKTTTKALICRLIGLHMGAFIMAKRKYTHIKIIEPQLLLLAKQEKPTVKSQNSLDQKYGRLKMESIAIIGNRFYMLLGFLKIAKTFKRNIQHKLTSEDAGMDWLSENEE